MWTCKHCNHDFDFHTMSEKGNHSRHCGANPRRKESYKKVTEGNRNHWDRNLGKLKKFDVSCDCCGKIFAVKEREKQHPKKDKYYCSRSCANSIGGKAKAEKHHYDEVAHYTTIAWRYHEKKCIVCGEENVVAVHHLNENHDDNRPENLVPLCPTHHLYMHSRFRILIQEIVDKYIREKWGHSSIGGASALQAEGCRFDPDCLHQTTGG